DAARTEKVIGAPLEAKVVLTADSATWPLLKQYRHELPSLFIVSEVDLCEGDSLRAGVQRAGGTKCERGWKYTHDHGSDKEFPTICAACAEAVRETLANV